MLSDGGQRTTSKLQNSPGSFITVSLEVIGIRGKTTENLSLSLFNNNSSLLNLLNVSQHGFKSENQGDFKYSIADITTSLYR